MLVPRTNPGLDRWNPVGIRTAAAMEMHGGAETNVVDAGDPEIGPPVSVPNPNGIESSSPGLPAAGYPGNRAHNTHQP